MGAAERTKQESERICFPLLSSRSSPLTFHVGQVHLEGVKAAPGYRGPPRNKATWAPPRGRSSTKPIDRTPGLVAMALPSRTGNSRERTTTRRRKKAAGRTARSTRLRWSPCMGIFTPLITPLSAVYVQGHPDRNTGTASTPARPHRSIIAHRRHQVRRAAHRSSILRYLPEHLTLFSDQEDRV